MINIKIKNFFKNSIKTYIHVHLSVSWKNQEGTSTLRYNDHNFKTTCFSNSPFPWITASQRRPTNWIKDLCERLFHLFMWSSFAKLGCWETVSVLDLSRYIHTGHQWTRSKRWRAVAHAVWCLSERWVTLMKRSCWRVVTWRFGRHYRSLTLPVALDFLLSLRMILWCI